MRMPQIIIIYMSKRQNMRSTSKEESQLTRVSLVRTQNTTLPKRNSRSHQRQQDQVANFNSWPDKFKGRMAKTMMLRTRESGGKRKRMVQCSNNNQRRKTTVTLAAKKSTMMLRWKTSKSHHSKNVVDSRNRTHHTIVVATEQTCNTIGREETTAKWQSCKNSL